MNDIGGNNHRKEMLLAVVFNFNDTTFSQQPSLATLR
jgi:hypothetical protein